MALSFFNSYLVIYFLIFKTIRSWKKNFKSASCWGIRKNQSVFISWSLQSSHYSQLSLRAAYLFVYYADVNPQDFTEDMVMQYLLYLSKTLGCSRVKCKMAAQSISFFFRHVLKQSYVIPTVIYPRKSTKLPPVMSATEIKALIDGVNNIKHRTIIMLLYSTGMRLGEIARLKITDIDSKNMRIKIVQGKGAKDRFTILSQQVLQELRAYYIIYKPKEYLFNGSRVGG